MGVLTVIISNPNLAVSYMKKVSGEWSITVCLEDATHKTTIIHCWD